MVVIVERDGVKYPCKNEEQLKLFLEAGYKEIPEKAEETKPKRVIKKK